MRAIEVAITVDLLPSQRTQNPDKSFATKARGRNPYGPSPSAPSPPRKLLRFRFSSAQIASQDLLNYLLHIGEEEAVGRLLHCDLRHRVTQG
jgi:hypothetical protein